MLSDCQLTRSRFKSSNLTFVIRNILGGDSCDQTSDQGQAHPLLDTLSPGLIRASLEELSTQGGTRREGRTHYNKTDWLQV